MNSSFSIFEGKVNDEHEENFDFFPFVEDGNIVVPDEVNNFDEHSKSEKKEDVSKCSSTHDVRSELKTNDEEECNEINQSKRERSPLQLKVVKVGSLNNKIKNDNRKYIIVKPQKLISRKTFDSDKADSYSSSSSSGLNEPNVRNELGFPCLKCGVIAAQEITAERHRKAHVSGYLCLYCPQAFFKKHTSEMHIQLHRDGLVKHVYDNCQCKICGGSFISLMYLEFHITEIHGNEILLNPKIIHFSTSSLDEMGDLRINDVKRYKKYKCGICNALFTFPLNLDCHMEFHKESVFSCGFCKCSFTLLDDLLIHMKIHDNRSLGLMLEDYVSNFEECFDDGDTCFQRQNSFEQILEIEDQSQSGMSMDSESHLRRVHKRGSKKKFLSLKERESRPHLKVRKNTSGLSNLKILNKKIITRKKETTNQIQQSNQTNYKIKTKDWFKNQICVGQEYVNPYLFHYLPNGKFSHYFENIE